MALRSTDYALLAQASYKDPEVEQRGPAGVQYKPITLDGVEYRPIAFKDDPHTGFQATAYDHVNANGSHDVVIAYRGTEFDREPVHDGIVDAGMALAGVNAQMADSLAFTRQVMEKVQGDAGRNHYPVNFTVTGHSLGGTLAEINAYKFGLHGETFNAFGAAGLIHGIPEGGTQVIDHVRATDVVSAASPHFGQVREYAIQQDVDATQKAGYSNTPFLNVLPTHAPVLGKIQGQAHAIANFVPSDISPSIISTENAQRYQANHIMIDAYRGDIRTARAVAAIPGEAVATQVGAAVGAGVYVAEKTEQVAKLVGDEAHQAYDYTKAQAVQGVHAAERIAQSVGAAAVTAGQYAGHEAHQAYDATKQTVEHGAHVAQHAASEAVQGVSQALHAAAAATSREASQAYDKLSHPGSWFDHKPAAPAPRLDRPDHPDHTMFKQACGAVHQIDAEHGRTSDQHSANLAAALTVAAKAQGMNKIDQVHLSADGSHAFAAQNTAPLKTVAQVETLQALNTPVEHSTQQIAQVNQTLQQQAQVQAQAQQQAPQPSNPSMTR